MAGKKAKSAAGGGNKPAEKKATKSGRGKAQPGGSTASGTAKQSAAAGKTTATDKELTQKKMTGQAKATRVKAASRLASKSSKASGTLVAKRSVTGRATGAQAVSIVSSMTSSAGKPGGNNRRRLRKTWLKKKDLKRFEELLLAKRAELIGDMEGMSREALSKNRTESAGDVSMMPTHMADLGSDNWEQEFTLGLIEAERNLLREIDEALDRIRNRTYGICLATNEPISMERLDAKPWAKYTIEYARKRELGFAP